MRGTSLEIVIPLPNGGSLRCGPGENHEHGELCLKTRIIYRLLGQTAFLPQKSI